jgi:GxxExxY protein
LLYEKQTYDLNAAFFAIHNELGNGFNEKVYQEAIEYEFGHREIPYKREVKLGVRYKDVILNQYFYADFICFDNIIVEIKAVKTLLPEHTQQVANYLKATSFKLGLLVNFGYKSLQFKRVIFTGKHYRAF